MLKQKKLSRLLTVIRYSLVISYQTLRQPSFVTIEGIKLRIGNHVSEYIRKTLYVGRYERAELLTVKYRLNHDDVDMEIGAGLGFISSYCAKKIGSDKVFTYEANPALEEHIRDTLKLNGGSPTLEPCLIGEQTGEESFYLHKDFWASSTRRLRQTSKVVKVPMKSFNQEVK